jgi:hypothetical protein
MKRLAIALALASLAASVGPAGARTEAASAPEVRPDTIIHAQWGRPPWSACVRWNARTRVCLDRGWRGRPWRSWYGRRTCGPRHGWWIDSRGRWRRC